MELALIDDDTLYHTLIRECFSDIGIKVTCFTCGESFIKVTPSDAMRFGFIIIDHTLSDMTGVQLVKLIKPALESEICLVSTYGNALTIPEKKGLGVSGDFQKTNMEDILSWFSFFKYSVQKKITN